MADSLSTGCTLRRDRVGAQGGPGGGNWIAAGCFLEVAPSVSRNIGEKTASPDGIRLCFRYVFSGRKSIAVLDEQPGGARGRAPVSASANQNPRALEFASVQTELEIAASQCCIHVILLWIPLTVPPPYSPSGITREHDLRFAWQGVSLLDRVTAPWARPKKGGLPSTRDENRSAGVKRDACGRRKSTECPAFSRTLLFPLVRAWLQNDVSCCIRSVP